MQISLPSNLSPRDPRHVLAVRQALERAMTRRFDARGDRQVVSQVSQELHASEDLVASQLTAVRLQAANQVVTRMRDRAAAEGLSPAAAARLTTVAAMQAAALAARDGLLRAQRLQRERLGVTRALAELYVQEQDRALMQRFEQSDEELQQDFDDALREISEGEPAVDELRAQRPRV